MEFPLPSYAKLQIVKGISAPAAAARICYNAAATLATFWSTGSAPVKTPARAVRCDSDALARGALRVAERRLWPVELGLAGGARSARFGAGFGAGGAGFFGG